MRIPLNIKEEVTRQNFEKNSKGKISDFRILGRQLGEGAYAIVRMAEHLEFGEIVAVKTYNRLKLSDPHKMRCVRREIEIIEKLSHQNIVMFIDCFENRRNIHLVLEYAGKNNLKTAIERKSTTRNILLRYFQELLLAVLYIHSMNIVHRDLQLENIVINEDDSVKLVDFGFARTEKEGELLKDICGTPNYMSPELSRRTRYNGRQSDVWSLGVVYFYMLTKTFPFVGKNHIELLGSIFEGKPDFSLVDVDEDRELLKSIFVPERQRVSVSQILNYSNFDGININ